MNKTQLFQKVTVYHQKGQFALVEKQMLLSENSNSVLLHKL